MNCYPLEEQKEAITIDIGIYGRAITLERGNGVIHKRKQKDEKR